MNFKRILILSIIVSVFTITVFTSKVMGGQEGTATIVVSAGGGSIDTIQRVNIDINAGFLRNAIMTDLLFAKVVINYDPTKLELTEDPKLLLTHWQYPIYSQTKAEVESQTPGKITLISGVSSTQQPIDYASNFARIIVKKKSPNLTGTTTISINLNQTQIINSPAQDTIVTAQNLTLSL